MFCLILSCAHQHSCIIFSVLAANFYMHGGKSITICTIKLFEKCNRFCTDVLTYFGSESSEKKNCLPVSKLINAIVLNHSPDSYGRRLFLSIERKETLNSSEYGLLSFLHTCLDSYDMLTPRLG